MSGLRPLFHQYELRRGDAYRMAWLDAEGLAMASKIGWQVHIAYETALVENNETPKRLVLP